MNAHPNFDGCGKKHYHTWDHAENDARKLRRSKSEPKAAYWCRRCQSFHVGTPLGEQQGHFMARTKAAKLKAKRGRPRKEGIREPNGRLSRAEEPPAKLALETRARMLGISVVKAQDQKAATFIGYLNIIGASDGLSDPQYAALDKFMEIRRDYLIAIKAPDATARSSATGRSGEAISDEYVKWCQRSVKAFGDARKAIYEGQNQHRTENLWAALDLCVIQSQPLHHMIGTVRTLGNVLAKHFGY
jgi:hypothetical protein